MWCIVQLTPLGKLEPGSLRWTFAIHAVQYACALRRTFPETRYFVVHEDELELFAQREE